MPYNPAGLFSLVASYFAQPGSTIRTEQHNPVFEDVASALSNVLVRDGRAPMTGPLNMNGNAITGVAPGRSSNEVATVSQGVPIGAVMDFAGVVAPFGWMFCYGQAVSRITYATLFSIIGTTYGPGDGSTTFNLPDLRDVAVVGRGNMGGIPRGLLSKFSSTVLGSVFGSQEQSLSIIHLPDAKLNVDIPAGQGRHSHPIDGSKIVSARVLSYGNDVGYGPTTISEATLPAMSGTANLDGGNQAHPNVQPTIIMNKIIRVSYDG